jgi:hypothetical protein
MLQLNVRNLGLSEQEISDFCQRWRITEFALWLSPA